MSEVLGLDGPGWYGFGPSALLYTGIICNGRPERLLGFYYPKGVASVQIADVTPLG